MDSMIFDAIFRSTLLCSALSLSLCVCTVNTVDIVSEWGCVMCMSVSLQANEKSVEQLCTLALNRCEYHEHQASKQMQLQHSHTGYLLLLGARASERARPLSHIDDKNDADERLTMWKKNENKSQTLSGARTRKRFGKEWNCRIIIQTINVHRLLQMIPTPYNV